MKRKDRTMKLNKRNNYVYFFSKINNRDNEHIKIQTSMRKI